MKPKALIRLSPILGLVLAMGVLINGRSGGVVAQESAYQALSFPVSSPAPNTFERTYGDDTIDDVDMTVQQTSGGGYSIVGAIDDDHTSVEVLAPLEDPKHFVNDDIQGLARSGNRIFWYTNCGGDTSPSRSRIRSKLSLPTLATPITDHYFPEACEPESRVASANITVDESYIYWITANGRVVRLHQWAVDDSEMTVISQTETDPSSVPPFRYYIGVSNDHVYWSEGTKILRTPKSGGARQDVYDSLSSQVRELFVLPNNDFLFLAANENLVFADFGLFGDIPSWPSKIIAAGVTGFVVDDASTRVYFAAKAAGGPSMLVASKRLSDLDALHDTHAAIDGVGNPTVPELAADDESVYWFEQRGGAGNIVRQSLAEPPSPKAIGTNTFAFDLIVEPTYDYLYWADNLHIYRLSTDATPITLDLVATGLEVVQTIQRPANDVPLVADKSTYVRLFGRIGSSSEGLTEIRPWPVAVLEGYEADGTTRLPGSPLTPEAGYGPLRDTGVDRTSREASLWFKLPNSWTKPGTIKLRGVINPNRVVRETNYVNNIQELTDTFLHKAPVCLYMVPVRTTSGTIGSYRPAYQPIFDRAQVLLPTHELWLYWRGGSPIEEYEFPFSLGPYEVSKSDDDSGSIVWKLFLRNLFADDPDDCDRLNARTHHVGMLPGSHPNRAVNGKALGDALIFFALTGNNGDSRNSYLGGVTLAHELGHNYGRDHVFCSKDRMDYIDEEYPYPPCQLDRDDIGPDMQHIGYDPISRRLVLPTDAGDLMSYAHTLTMPKPRWPSDYTYEAIEDEIDFRPFRMAASQAATASASGSRLVMVSVNETTGESAFAFTYEVDGNALAKVDALIADTPADATHELWVYDSGGTLVAQLPVISQHSYSEGADSSLYLTLLAESLDSARLALVDIGGAIPQTVTELSAGGGEPSVNITAPAGGETIDDTLIVRWTSNDPDGDDLRHTVRYSNDGGATWQVLVSEYPANELEIDTTGLPGTDSQGLIQVIVSDGVNSASATSALFTLLMKAPQGHIFFETDTTYGAAERVTVRHDETILLRGYGYDDEDGPVAGEGFQWQVEGPVDRVSSGETALLTNLPPGTYAVTLSVTDSDGNTNETTATLIVLPKSVPDANVAPFIDGLCDDSAYEADRHPIILRYNSGEIAYLHMIHADHALFACFSGMPVGADSPGDWVGLRIDTDNEGGALPQNDDLSFAIGRDGIPITAAGNGSTFVVDTIPQGLQGTIEQGDVSWGAELRIDQARLGGWEKNVRMYVSHSWRNFVGDDTIWPEASIWNQPSTWGAAYLGELSPPSTTQNLTVTPSSGDPGQTVTLSGSGYTPGGYSGTIRWDGTDIEAFSIPAGGSFSVPFTVPEFAMPGLHSITVCSFSPCTTGDYDEQSATVSFGIMTDHQVFLPLIVR